MLDHRRDIDGAAPLRRFGVRHGTMERTAMTSRLIAAMGGGLALFGGMAGASAQPISPGNRIASVHELYVGPATAARTADKSKACPTRPVRVIYSGYGEPTTVCPDSYPNGNMSAPGPDSR